MADIARAANVAVGTVYLYFPTKEALFLALVNDVVELLKAEMDSLRRDFTNPVTLVRARNDTFFRFAERHRDLFRIVFGASNPFHEVVRRAQRTVIAYVSGNPPAGAEWGGGGPWPRPRAPGRGRRGGRRWARSRCAGG